MKFHKRHKQVIDNYIDEEVKQGDLDSLPLDTSHFKKVLGKSCDIVVKQIHIAGNEALTATLMFVDGLVSQDKISDFVIKPLVESESFQDVRALKNVIPRIMKGAVYYASAQLIDKMADGVHAILSGCALLVFDSEQKAVSFDTKGYEKRAFSASTEESSFKGAKLAFVEDLRMNTSRIRLEIRSPNLTIEEMILGKQTHTNIAVIYMRNLCKQEFMLEVKKRLEAIRVDKVSFLTDVSSKIVDHKYTVFPQVQFTEKPDSVSASLLEGKVAIIIDGISYALVMPVVMNDFFQVPADYGANYMIASLFRILRYILFFAGLILPGFYISMTEYHMEMVPHSLAYAIAVSKSGTPFPISVEVFLMMGVFFSLIEATSRIPQVIASTVSIVGGLVLGEAAITAKLVSPGVIVVVAFSAIASMAIPNKDLNFAIWIWLLINVLASSILGIFGLTICVLLLLYHLADMEVLGVPYLAPFSGGKRTQLGDSVIRLPAFLLKKRPYHLQPKDERRQP